MPDPRTVLLRVAYDGTAFAGWQIQTEPRTVQGELLAAVREMDAGVDKIYGASRTDAGVHARGQAVHFVTASGIPLEGFVKGLNSKIGDDVAVLEATEVGANFHARFSARGKRYRYVIWNAPTRHPLACRYAWHRHQVLDAAAMDAPGQALLGRHDFSAFRAADCDRDNPVRELRRLEVRRSGPRVEIVVEATAFLKNMVRIIVGTLVYVGRGKLPPEAVGEILAARDRTRAGPTAPARGLCLEVVFYDDVPPRTDGTPHPG